MPRVGVVETMGGGTAGIDGNGCVVAVLEGAAMTRVTDLDDDMLTPDRVADPYPFFDELRSTEPVHWSDRYRAWFISRWDDVFEALRDPRFSSDRVKPVFDTKLTDEQRTARKPMFDILQYWMVFNDPPDHTRLRGLVNRAFTPKAIAALRPRIEEVVAEQLEAVRGRGRADLIRDFAFPIPAVVIAEMLGVPAAERDLFKSWSDAIMVLVFGAADAPGGASRPSGACSTSPATSTTSSATSAGQPARQPDSDLIGAQDADDRLTDEEIVSTCTLLLFGGHETTTNLIGNGTRTLLHHPDQLRPARGGARRCSSRPSRSCCASTDRRRWRCAGRRPTIEMRGADDRRGRPGVLHPGRRQP